MQLFREFLVLIKIIVNETGVFLESFINLTKILQKWRLTSKTFAAFLTFLSLRLK